ncbi:MAG: hypothetical protein KC964_19790 [Candidatus Omnitrophica bacterium]|nr:hypothetical protein [Candidatus Omnitrophota bacterium]
MDSVGVTLQSDRMDVYLRDEIGLGPLTKDCIKLQLWMAEGLINLSLSPYRGFSPISYHDMTSADFLLTLVDRPVALEGSVTKVNDSNSILDSVEFSLDGQTIGDFWTVIQRQYRMRMSRAGIEERTCRLLMDRVCGLEAPLVLEPLMAQDCLTI